ncbi:MAG: hypothetical protein LAP61_04675 [Acidobacteriia bacterium]|nr:hypothetical protein [Terriglobia bacterium]
MRIALSAALLGGTTASANIIYDSGSVTFSSTGTQFGRISRDGISSVWGVVKAFPGVTGAPTARAFELFDILDTGDTPYIQIGLDDPTASLFMAGYLNSFNPVNVSPSFGLSTNYLGDPGDSQPFGSPSFFQIIVTPHSHLVIPINELNPGGGAGQSFELLVEGFYDSSYSETPEPASLLLCGAGILALGLFRAFARVPKP